MRAAGASGAAAVAVKLLVGVAARVGGRGGGVFCAGSGVAVFCGGSGVAVVAVWPGGVQPANRISRMKSEIAMDGLRKDR